MSQPFSEPWSRSGSRTAMAEPLWARLALPALGLAAATVCLLDLTATLASLLSGHGIPHLLGGWITGPVRLLAHPLDPQAAFTDPRAAPPPALLWVVLALLLAAATFLALRVATWWSRRHEGAELRSPARKRHGLLSGQQAARAFGEKAARLQAARLHPTQSADELRHRPIAELAIPLGRCEGAPVYASHEHAAALLASMRQGKSGGIVAAAALNHRGALAYTTTKPDDLGLFFLAPEGSPGRTILFNPDGLSGLPTAAFDPSLRCEDPDTARLRAEAICARQRARGQDRGLDWALLAEKMLKYLLHAAALEHLDGSRAADPQRPVGMARVVQWAANERLTAAADILRTSPQASRWAELVEDMSRSAP